MAACLAAAGGSAGGTRAAGGCLAPAPPSVMLVSIDTLRADHVGSYGYQAAATPVLDALAARGLRFEQAATVVPLTLPAHGSLSPACSRLPRRARQRRLLPGRQLTTLAEVLQAAWLPHWRVRRRVRPRPALGHRAGVHRLLRRLRFRRSSRWPGPRRRAAAGQRSGRPRAGVAREGAPPAVLRVGASLRSARPYSRRNRIARAFRHAREPTTARSPPTDAQVGRCWRPSRPAAAWTTLIVVVGDHGESLGEHGEQQHGFFVYDAAVRIPLIVAGPGVPARVVRDQVRIVDVMPTILDLLGAASPPPCRASA